MGIPCPLRDTMCQRADAVHLRGKDLLLRPDKHSVILHSIPILLLFSSTLTLQKLFVHLLEVEALLPCRSRAISSLTTVANSLAKTGGYAESELR